MFMLYKSTYNLLIKPVQSTFFSIIITQFICYSRFICYTDSYVTERCTLYDHLLAQFFLSLPAPPGFFLPAPGCCSTSPSCPICVGVVSWEGFQPYSNHPLDIQEKNYPLISSTNINIQLLRLHSMTVYVERFNPKRSNL